MFLLIADTRLLTNLSDSVKLYAPDFVYLIAIYSLACMLVVEGAFVFLFRKTIGKTPGLINRVPFELVRQRLEAWEQVEQIWYPTKIGRVTTDLVESAAPFSDLCWLTSVHPKSVVEAICRSSGKRDYDNVRVIIPGSADESLDGDSTQQGDLSTRGRFRNDIQEFPGLARRTRKLVASAVPRIRLLIVDSRVAMIHLPVGLDGAGRNVSSNYAVIVRDPARVSEVKGWFEQIWRASRAIEPSETTTESARISTLVSVRLTFRLPRTPLSMRVGQHSRR